MKPNGSIQIETFEKTEQDLSFIVKNCALVRFTNRGQSRVWIDEDEVLEPGESFVEADDCGRGINHKYTLKFIALASPPAVDEPVTYAGDRLHIRKHNR